jgi:hypothetical protein
LAERFPLPNFVLGIPSKMNKKPIKNETMTRKKG